MLTTTIITTVLIAAHGPLGIHPLYFEVTDQTYQPSTQICSLSLHSQVQYDWELGRK